MPSGRRFLCAWLALALLLGFGPEGRADEPVADPASLPSVPVPVEPAREGGPASEADQPIDPPGRAAPAEKADKADKDDPAFRWGNRNALQWIISHGNKRFDVVEWTSRPDLFTLGNLNEWTAKGEYDLDSGLGFDVRWWAGPEGNAQTQVPNLPPRVYDFYYQAIWRQRWADGVTSEVCVRPGLYTDFRTTPVDAFRVPGHAAGVFRLDPSLYLVAGVQHLQRVQVKVLPVAGVLWEPNDRLQCRLVFPEPKLSYRLGAGGDLLIYARGEYGGGTWAYKNDEGHSDWVEYSDVRAAVGFEWGRRAAARPPRFPDATAFVEVGYVFDRHLRFAGALTEPAAPPGLDAQPREHLVSASSRAEWRAAGGPARDRLGHFFCTGYGEAGARLFSRRALEWTAASGSAAWHPPRGTRSSSALGRRASAPRWCWGGADAAS